MSLASWLIGGAAVYFGICGFVLLFWREGPSEYEQQRAELERATRELGVAIGRELEPALRRVVAAVEKIAERL